jgi:hypothetical protein
LVHRRVRPQRSVRSLRRGLSDHNPTEVKTIKSGLLKPFRRITSIITIMPLPTCIPRGCTLCCCSAHHTPTYLCQTSQSYQIMRLLYLISPRLRRARSSLHWWHNARCHSWRCGTPMPNCLLWTGCEKTWRSQKLTSYHKKGRNAGLDPKGHAK